MGDPMNVTMPFRARAGRNAVTAMSVTAAMLVGFSLFGPAAGAQTAAAAGGMQTLAGTASAIDPGAPLAFDRPARSTHKRMVFAHYFPPYPVSIDNKTSSADYYAVNYLKPSGENGAFASVGGLLRDRPMPRPPIAGDWK